MVSMIYIQWRFNLHGVRVMLRSLKECKGGFVF